MRDLFKSLNLLFGSSDDKIQEFIDKINSGTIDNKYAKLFKVVNNNLIFIPLNLIVVKKSDIKELLTEFYNKNSGTGILGFYKLICREYANITRNEVKEFLEQTPGYLLTKQHQYLPAKPISEKFANNRWQIDLIDMSMYSKNNKGYNYILNCIDVYSRYAFIRLLKKKEAINVREAFINITNTSNVTPNVIQSDNGTEFMGEFHEYLKDNNIRHILNSTYSPNQNAIVERANRDIRRIINNYFANRNTKVYYDVIEAVQTAKNKAYNSNLKCSPIDLWTPTKLENTKRILPKTILKPEDKKLLLAYDLNQKSNQRMENFKSHDTFKLNDTVLVSMDAVFSTHRKRIKAGESKHLPVKYLPIVYRIYQVIQSRKPTTRNRYILQNTETDNTISQNTKDGLKFKYFSVNDIIPCKQDIEFEIDVDDAIKLNGISPNNYDLNY